MFCSGLSCITLSISVVRWAITANIKVGTSETAIVYYPQRPRSRAFSHSAKPKELLARESSSSELSILGRTKDIIRVASRPLRYKWYKLDLRNLLSWGKTTQREVWSGVQELSSPSRAGYCSWRELRYLSPNMILLQKRERRLYLGCLKSVALYRRRDHVMPILSLMEREGQSIDVEVSDSVISCKSRQLYQTCQFMPRTQAATITEMTDTNSTIWMCFAALSHSEGALGFDQIVTCSSSHIGLCCFQGVHGRSLAALSTTHDSYCQSSRK